jgi:hypothetical protein
MVVFCIAMCAAIAGSVFSCRLRWDVCRLYGGSEVLDSYWNKNSGRGQNGSTETAFATVCRWKKLLLTFRQSKVRQAMIH